MRRVAIGGVGAAAAVAGTALASVSGPAAHRGDAYPDAPPPATTGGFGEPTCAVCHFEPAEPDSPGSLTIEGLPERYAPGRRYTLTIALDRTGMKRAGFELSARLADGPECGLQAGELEGEDAGVAITEQAGVQYAHHTAGGTLPTSPARARWRIHWTAPNAPVRVVFHVAGNAANGDASALGDRVYAIERSLDPVATP